MHRHPFLFCILLLAIVALQPVAAQPTATTFVYLPIVRKGETVTLSAQEQAVLNAVNQERAAFATRNGTPCPALTVSAALQRTAAAHSRDMAMRNFFSHTNPEGQNTAARALAQGYPGDFVGENLAVGQDTAQEVMYAKIAWMNSDDHRATILNCQFTETGIGYHFQPDDQKTFLVNGRLVAYYHYWAQVFGNPNL